MKIILILSLLLVVNNCTPLALGIGAVSKTGVVVAQERTTGKAVDDFSIWTKIKHAFLQEDASELLSKVSVEVIEGRVHLTGKVTSQDSRISAVRLSWVPYGVREVINDIQIVDKPDENRTLPMVMASYKESSLDSWIATSVRTKLLFAKHVQSLNYNIEVVNRIVYLIGIAQDTNELNLVTNIASTIKHVERVVSHVVLKNDEERGK